MSSQEHESQDVSLMIYVYVSISKRLTSELVKSIISRSRSSINAVEDLGLQSIKLNVLIEESCPKVNLSDSLSNELIVKELTEHIMRMSRNQNGGGEPVPTTELEEIQIQTNMAQNEVGLFCSGTKLSSHRSPSN
ncbi:hypothetical protein BpHYR1_019946 [Brachionus plicatilis]|uniref:Uncharacterized protein n=1 Tax=Brachionus plicatilis TaxID=10195 RepID=A0A3M7S628_BRAPC|nr:hypothetical protein BpHYR1_019946 [Brachionus plicatilis]